MNLRAEKKETTLEPILHPRVTRLVSEEGNEIYVKRIWEVIKETIQGYFDEKRPNEYQTLEYGTIYNKSISNILEHTFGGRPKHREHGNTFIFDVEELSRVGKAYSLPTKIQTKIVVVKEKRRGDVIMEIVLKTLKGLKALHQRTLILLIVRLLKTVV